jgi:hypothetical protein
MVISPTLDFSRAISSSRSSRSRSFRAVAAPASARSRQLGQPGDRDIRLPGHQFQRLAAQQSGDNRHLALNGKTLGAIPINARWGAGANFGGALRRPFGLAPVIIRHL